VEVLPWPPLSSFTEAVPTITVRELSDTTSYDQLCDVFIYLFTSSERSVRWVGYVVHMGEIRYAYKISHKILKEETISDSRLTWQNNTEMGLK
jgi:hypothetical protein